MSYKANNYIGGSTVYVTKKGLFTSYPYNLGEIGTHYDIPNCHTWDKLYQIQIMFGWHLGLLLILKISI